MEKLLVRRRLGKTATLIEDKLISQVSHLYPGGKNDHVVIFQWYIINKVIMCIVLSKDNYDKLSYIIRKHDWSGGKNECQ